MRAPLTFGRWSPLLEAPDNMPEGPGLFQIRTRHGLLIDYPRGKSAMLRYGAAPVSLRTSVAAIITGLRGGGDDREHEEQLCRWAPTRAGGSVDPSEHLDRLLRGFIDRFGAPPRDQPPSAM